MTRIEIIENTLVIVGFGLCVFGAFAWGLQ
jgi:hypothetical protein